MFLVPNKTNKETERMCQSYELFKLLLNLQPIYLQDNLFTDLANGFSLLVNSSHRPSMDCLILKKVDVTYLLLVYPQDIDKKEAFKKERNWKLIKYYVQKNIEQTTS